MTGLRFIKELSFMACLLLLATACGQAENIGDLPALNSQNQFCSQDADCTIVPYGCCSCNNSKSTDKRAINKAYEEEWLTQNQKFCMVADVDCSNVDRSLCAEEHLHAGCVEKQCTVHILD